MPLARLASFVHKWLALLVGIQIVFWVVSGLFFTLFPIEQIRSENLIRPAQAQTIDTTTLASLANLRGNQNASPTKLTIERRPMGQVIVAEFANEPPVLFDAATLQRLSPLSATQAGGVARAHVTLTSSGAKGNNLKNVTLNLPLGVLTCITGVSGGGKSTLIIETLYKVLARRLNGASEHPAPYDEIDGLHHLDKVIDIDQSPIGRTPRSNPATYTGAFGPIRDWFAGLPEAKARGFGPGRFSFNVKGGRCEACQGVAFKKLKCTFYQMYM